MIIMKFGGSSLADAARIRHVGQIVLDSLSENPIVVLSAMGKTTDLLINAGQAALAGLADPDPIRQFHLQVLSDLELPAVCMERLFDELDVLLRGISLLRDLSPKTMDCLMSFGERMATRLFCAYLSGQGIKACHLDGWEAGIATCSNHTRAEVHPDTYRQVPVMMKGLEAGSLPVVTGFIAKDAQGSITTLGRGGSDLTAAVLGAAMGAREIQVWKDVHGILSADPKLVPEAIPVSSISFEEALELAYFGAKVLHPMSIVPAMKNEIPVRVKNSYDPSHPGTLITANRIYDEGLVKAMTFKQGQMLVHICSTRMLGQYGFLAKVFQIFADLKISVDVIATSEVSLSLTIENQARVDDLQKMLAEVATVSIQTGKSIISLIGNMMRSAEILERSLRTLSREGISVRMISHGASKVNISLVVDDGQALTGIRLLHELFFEPILPGGCSAV